MKLGNWPKPPPPFLLVEKVWQEGREAMLLNSPPYCMPPSLMSYNLFMKIPNPQLQIFRMCRELLGEAKGRKDLILRAVSL